MEKKTKKMAAALAVVAVVLMVAAGLLIYQGLSLIHIFSLQS